MASNPKTRRKHFGIGFWIWWDRPDGSRGGPAQVWLLALSRHRRWAYVEIEGNGLWVAEDCITEIVRGSGRPKGRDPSGADS